MMIAKKSAARLPNDSWAARWAVCQHKARGQVATITVHLYKLSLPCSTASGPGHPCGKMGWEVVCPTQKCLGPTFLTQAEGEIAWCKAELSLLTWGGCNLQGERSGAVTIGMNSSSLWECHLQIPLCSTPCPLAVGILSRRTSLSGPHPLSLCLVRLFFHILESCGEAAFTLLLAAYWGVVSAISRATVWCPDTGYAPAIY